PAARGAGEPQLVAAHARLGAFNVDPRFATGPANHEAVDWSPRIIEVLCDGDAFHGGPYPRGLTRKFLHVQRRASLLAQADTRTAGTVTGTAPSHDTDTLCMNHKSSAALSRTQLDPVNCHSSGSRLHDLHDLFSYVLSYFSLLVEVQEGSGGREVVTGSPLNPYALSLFAALRKLLLESSEP